MNKNPVIYVLTNVINKKQYVGSTGNLARRRSQHLSDLRLGVHPVSDLQSDYNQFGRDSIIFSVLLRLPPQTCEEILIKYEQVYIDRLLPQYNKNGTAGKHIGSYIRTEAAKEKRRIAMTGRKQSPETIAKRIASVKASGKQKLKKISEEQKKHLSEINMGEKNPNWGLKRSDETRQAISSSNSKVEYTFINPEGYECKFYNLSKFCEINDIEYWPMRQLYRGKKKEWQGWTFISALKID